jgi:hypothetical protein
MMKAIIFLLENKLENSDVSASTQDDAFPLANLSNCRKGKPFKLTSHSGDIVIDLLMARTCDAVALLGHNLTSGATLTLEANSSDSWTAPPFQESLSYRAEDLYKKFTGASYRYWRLVVSDAGNSDNARIGELLLGQSSLFSRMPAAEYDREDEYNNIALETGHGQKWVYSLGGPRRSFNLTWNNANTTVAAEIESLLYGAEGNYRPFLFVPDSSAAECYYVRLNPKLSRRVRYAQDQYADIKIALTEEPRGQDL